MSRGGARAAGVAAIGAMVPLGQVISSREVENEGAPAAIDHNAIGEPLRIGGQSYSSGVGLQSETTFAVTLRGAERFQATIALDDASPSALLPVCDVEVDGQVVWTQKAAPSRPSSVDLNLRGKTLLVFRVRDPGNEISKALVDCVEAKFIYSGEVPVAASVPVPLEDAPRLYPLPPAAARINGARVFGVRPGHPFIYNIPATGERPLKFSVRDLPGGLTLDSASGRISGRLTRPGTYATLLRADNAAGSSEVAFTIVAGERISLTPALGWNSWNCWAGAVDEKKILSSAEAMVKFGLDQHGWSYINIDDTWQGARPGPGHALQGNEKFPNLGNLADKIHGLGLKLGIYSTPWITSYATYPGGSADNPEGTWSKPTQKRIPNRKVKPWALGEFSFAEADARQWAEWGIDYLKYDWNPIEPPETEAMARALRGAGRDIIYSLSNSAPFAGAPDWARLANSWRTTGDIRDTWPSMSHIGFSQDKWHEYAGPGHWNDPDMLVVGYVGWGPKLHPTRLTCNEQYTHISLWSLLSAPLLIGCDLARLDDFTVSLLSNDEVLEIDQDPLGKPARQVWISGRQQGWVKELADGSHAVGLFNLAQQEQAISLSWKEIGLAPPTRMRDLWRQTDEAVNADAISFPVARHGVRLVRVWP